MIDDNKDILISSSPSERENYVIAREKIAQRFEVTKSKLIEPDDVGYNQKWWEQYCKVNNLKPDTGY